MSVHDESVKQLEMSARRLRVAQAYCQGQKVVEIAQNEGVHHSTISRDLDAIREEWKNARVGLIDAKSQEELAKIDHVEKVAWEAWQRSCEDAETHTHRVVTGRTAVEIGKENGEKYRRVVDLPPLETAEKVVRGQAGNPAYLERVCWCINRRCVLLGLDPAKRFIQVQEVGGGDGLTEEERREALTRIIAEMGWPPLLPGPSGAPGGAPDAVVIDSEDVQPLFGAGG